MNPKRYKAEKAVSNDTEDPLSDDDGDWSSSRKPIDNRIKKSGHQADTVVISSANEAQIIECLKEIQEQREEEKHKLPAEPVQITQANITRLTKLGFSNNVAQMALVKANNDFEEAVEWICINLPNEQLPKNFVTQRTVEVFDIHGSAFDRSEAIRKLMEYGFTKKQCQEALSLNGFEEEYARIELLKTFYPLDVWKISQDAYSEDLHESDIQTARSDERFELETILAEGEIVEIANDVIRLSVCNTSTCKFDT